MQSGHLLVALSAAIIFASDANGGAIVRNLPPGSAEDIRPIRY
jgi:hypothetical protein